MYHAMNKNFCRSIFHSVMALFLISALTCNPAFAKEPGAKKVSQTVKKATVKQTQIAPVGNYLFRFKVPVNIKLAGDLVKHTGSSQIRIACTVHPGSDTNFNNSGGRGHVVINLTNHAYNGTVTIDITAMKGDALAHNMKKWRCVMLAKTPSGGWSASLLNQFATPGSKTTYKGNL